MENSPLRKTLPALWALAAFLPAGCGEITEAPAVDFGEQRLVEFARKIHDRVIAIDTHVDIPFDFATDAADPGVWGRFRNDLPKMREGGLDAAFFVVYHGQGVRNPEAYREAYARTMLKFEGIRHMTYRLHPEGIELAYSAEDVERIHSEGKLVALIGVENAYPMGTDLSQVEAWHFLGARYMSLTHDGHNQFGDAAVEATHLGDDGPEWGGLSPLGLELVDELNRVGIMVDVSHAAKSTTMAAVERSRAPVIASHSSIRTLVDHPRNLDDEQLAAIRVSGGVAQITAVGAFLREYPPERGRAIRELRERFQIATSADIEALPQSDRTAYEKGVSEIRKSFPPATLRDFIDHIDYAVSLIGVDHVGISSDFDGGGGVTGWMDSSETFNVTFELVRRGYSEDEIRQLWGGNLLRVMREVERVAMDIKAGVRIVGAAFPPTRGTDAMDPPQPSGNRGGSSPDSGGEGTRAPSG